MSDMTVSERSDNCEVVLQKDIFRLAALLYSETTTDVFSTVDVLSHMVKCVFYESNTLRSVEDIISYIMANYKCHVSEEELEKVLATSMMFEKANVNGLWKYKLTQDEHEQISKNLSLNIDYYIAQFIEAYSISNPELVRDAIYKCLYELTTTNTNSYKVLFSLADRSDLTDSDLSVNTDDFSDKELEFVSQFVNWNNAEKNAAIANLVLCCLEYCLFVSGDKPNRLISNAIREREIFIDTNIIFRALGINGSTRKSLVLAFLNKCRQANIKIYVGRPTKNEFWNTVDYYLSQIIAFSRGKVFIGAYESLSDYNIFSFYEEWYSTHENLSLKYFRIYISALYNDFVKMYKIHDELIPNEIFYSEDFKNKRDTYAHEIISAKKM